MDCRRSMDLTAPVLARRCAAQRTSRLVPLNAAAEGTTSSSQQAFESVDQVATQQPSKAQGGACPFDTVRAGVDAPGMGACAQGLRRYKAFS